MSSTKDLCVLPPSPEVGCCDASDPAPAVPGTVFNSRGLSSIAYRMGTFTSFRQAMLNAVARPDLMAGGSTTLTADIGTADLGIAIGDFTQFPSLLPYRIKIGNEYLLVTAGAGTANWTVLRGMDQSTAASHSAGDIVLLDPPNPFATWKEGSNGDYHTMFIELWAYLADILTFYQERIANEAFLPTATQRDSLLRLAELIDYRPGPGAGASTLVAFTVQKGATVTIPAGFRVGSKASPGKTAAVFETSAATAAIADHNAIPVATVQYTNQFQRVTTGSRTVVLEGTANGLAVGDYVLVVENENLSNETPSAFRLTSVSVSKKTNTTTITWPEGRGLPYDQSVKKVALYAFRVSAAPFGANAPQWNTLPAILTTPTTNSARPYRFDWDDSGQQAFYIPFDTSLFLDGIYDDAKATPEAPGWALLVRNSIPNAFRVTDAQTVSHTGYTLNMKVTRLTLAKIVPFMFFPLRTTQVVAGSERLSLQNFLPVTDPVSGNTLVLAGNHPKLQSGQPVLVQGRLQSSGDTVAEFRVLDGPPMYDPLADTTTVTFTNSLSNPYDPASTVLMANVVEATQGETVKDEVLGSGDGSAFQSYALKKKPLTYLPSTDTEGSSAVKSALLVTVNGVEWTEEPTLVESAAGDHHFTTTLDDSGQTTVVFGDGYSGATPPTGRDNIHARYRKGLGSSGNVGADGIQQLIDSVPGVQKVTNPQASAGGADPESSQQIRVSGPLSMSTFGRAVSADDYAALALRFPGIVKAAGVWVRRDPDTLKAVAQPYIQLTVATADGTGLANTLLARNLRSFLDKHRDPNVSLRIRDFTPVYLDVALTVDIEDGFPREATRARVQAALNPDPNPNPDGSFGYFSIGNLNFGQSIHLSALYAAVQACPGVQDARITRLRRLDTDVNNPNLIRNDIFIRPVELAVIQNGRNNAPDSDGLLVVTTGIGGFADT